jgi:hypothetical protein
MKRLGFVLVLCASLHDDSPAGCIANLNSSGQHLADVKVILTGPGKMAGPLCVDVVLLPDGRFTNIDNQIMPESAIRSYFGRPQRDKNKVDLVTVSIRDPEKTSASVLLEGLAKLRCSAPAGTENTIFLFCPKLKCDEHKE